MKTVKKAVTTLGGVFLAALLIAALAPKATHGLVAALVQVANTTSSPVPVSNVKDQNPYQNAQFFPQSSTNCPGTYCIVSFNPVPAGYRLVITGASAAYELISGGTDAYVRLTSSMHPEIVHLLPPTGNVGLNLRVVSSPITFYVEAGDTPQMQMVGPVIVDPTVAAEGTIVGYLVPVS